MKLNVTVNGGCGGWVAYLHINGRSVAVARADFNGLDDLRHYAQREGYEGILIGNPSAPWARLVDCGGTEQGRYIAGCPSVSIERKLSGSH
jgi:hypothetical protein